MDPNVSDPSIWQLEPKCLRNEELTPSELAVAKAALNAAHPIERTIACEVLLRWPATDPETISRAVGALEGVCREAMTQPAQMDPRIALALGTGIPTKKIFGSTVIREFIYAAAKNTHKACRMNAIVALCNLAAAGDSEAERLIRTALDDPEPYVQTNAANCLRRLRQQKIRE